MELLRGRPARRDPAPRGRLSARDCARLGVADLRGPRSTRHEQRIVHRDIKTSNLFFTRDRVVKIMDFGLAKMLEEVRRARDGDRRHAVLHGARAGDRRERRPPRGPLRARRHALRAARPARVPFREGDVTFHHRHTPAARPARRAAPDLPDALAELVLQLMEKEPDARPGLGGRGGRPARGDRGELG